MRRGTGGVVVAVGCAALLLTGLVASARTPAIHTSQEDPNDANGALDVRLVELHHSTPTTPVWTFVTFSTWTVDRMWDKGYLLVYLDTYWSDRPDYYALIRSDGDRLRGELFRDKVDGPDVFLQDLTVWRGDAHRAAVKVPLSAMRIGTVRSVYSWYTVTLLTSAICPSVCLDRVPDAGMVEQLLPGATTTPPTTSPPTETTATPTG